MFVRKKCKRERKEGKQDEETPLSVHLSMVADLIVSVRPCLKPAVDADSYVAPAQTHTQRERETERERNREREEREREKERE